MTPPDDLSPPRRPIFLPVVIATVFLTIIGMTVGFTLGERHRKATQVGDVHTLPEFTGSASPSSSSAPPGKLCPATAQTRSHKLGYGVLTQKMQIHTDRTWVWICLDAKGGLFYQSWTHLDQPLTEDVNGLFLWDVEDLGGDQYTVTSKDGKDNVFKASATQFEVDKAGASPDIQKVTYVEH